MRDHGFVTWRGVKFSSESVWEMLEKLSGMKYARTPAGTTASEILAREGKPLKITYSYKGRHSK